MTLARTADEAALLLRSLEQLAAFDRQVIVTDGGAESAFRERLAALPGVIVNRPVFGPGLLAQIRTSMQAAYAAGVPRIFYTEPDKLAFFETGLGSMVDGLEGADRSGVHLAARTDAAFSTFPAIQRHTEQTINELTAQVVGIRGDYSYGPFVMPAALAPCIIALDEDVGWGWRHFAFVRARQLGMAVTLHQGPYECPPEQRVETQAERLHRVAQLDQNSRGLLLAQQGGR